MKLMSPTVYICNRLNPSEGGVFEGEVLSRSG
jgi:hypothetical protein